MCSSDLTVHPLESRLEDLDTVFRLSFENMRLVPAAQIQGMLQPVRKHIFNALSNFGSQHNPRETILSIACSFQLFTYIVGNDHAEIGWCAKRRTWIASFRNPRLLEPVFLENWFSIRKRDNSGHTIVRNTVTLQYSFLSPGKMQMTLSEVVLQSVGGGAAPLAFIAPRNGKPLRAALGDK